MKKFIATIVLGSLVSVNLIFALPTVNAQTTAGSIAECTVDVVSDVLGGAVSAVKGVVSGALNAISGGLLGGGGGDKSEVTVKKAETVENATLKNCLQALKAAALKVALANLKKRLLDRIVDDTIAWIQDSKQPKFITDFGSVFKDAADQAVADTLRDIGLGDLCTTNLISRARIQLELQRPVFSQQVSCTLSQVIANLEQFQKDFKAGGWVGYYEVLKPQNNPWGLEILTSNEIAQRKAQNQQAAQTAAIAGQGYQGTTMCLEWTLVAVGTGAPVPAGGSIVLVQKNPIVNSDPGFSNDPNSPPKKDMSSGITANLDVSKVAWTCTKKGITTPASTVGAITAKTSTADYDYLVNADDLSTYVSAIFDAAVNRLIKEGVKGLQNMGKSQSATGQPPTPLSTTSTRDQIYQGYGNEYQGATDLKKQLAQSLLDSVARMTIELANARSEISVVLALNQNLIATTTLAANCENSRMGAVCSSTTSTLAAAQGLQTELTADELNLAALPTQLQTVQTEAQKALSGASTVSEGELQTLLTQLNGSERDLSDLRTRLTGLETTIPAQAKLQYDEYDRCQNSGTYSCPL